MIGPIISGTRVVITTVKIGNKVHKVEKIREIICQVWPVLSDIVNKSIGAIAHVLARMNTLLGDQRGTIAIWNAARTAVDEFVGMNPQFVSQVLGQGMSMEGAINFFAQLFELLIK